MKHLASLSCAVFATGAGLLASAGLAQTSTPYKTLETIKTPGAGNIDYVYADSEGRRVYVPRGAQTFAFDLDTYKLAGTIAGVGGHGVAVDSKSHHGFSSSKPVSMFDTATLTKIKSIEVRGSPDGILYEPVSDRVWVFSHGAPNATLIDPKDGTVTGTLELGGAPEQAQSDGLGKLYVDLEDKNSVAVVDVKALKVTATYPLGEKGEGPAGLGLDAKNHILFAFCHSQNCVILNADDGKILATLPIGNGVDGGGFNPNTLEAFSSQGRDATLTIIKETSPTTFEVEQNVKTVNGAKTCSLDLKTGNIVLIATERPLAPPPLSAAAAQGEARPGTIPQPVAPTGDPRQQGGGRSGGSGTLDLIIVGR
jgi:DNA-binding beta-propeller fold protein YncE